MKGHRVTFLACVLATGTWCAPSSPAQATESATTANLNKVTLGGSLYSRLSLNDSQPDNSFMLRRARLSADFQPLSFLQGELDLEAAKAPAVKDAVFTLTYAPWLRLSSGQFKKPFSLLETTSTPRLPLVDRGIVNDRFVDSYGFGGRDVGAMLAGELGAFSYAAGVFNGTKGLEDIDPAKDVAARLTAKPFAGLRIGVSGAAKFRNVPGVDYPKRNLFAAGLDLRLKLGLLDLVSEALWGEAGTTKHGPGSVGIVTYLVLRLPKLSEMLAVRPLTAFEFLDDNVRRPDDYAMSGVVGVNLHVAKLLRVMVQARLTRSTTTSSTPEERLVVVQLALDSKMPLSPQTVGTSDAEGSQP